MCAAYRANNKGLGLGMNVHRQIGVIFELVRMKFMVFIVRHFCLMPRRSLVGQGLLTVEVLQSHSDIPHSVGLLWTRDQPVADTSFWQHTTLTRNKHPCPGGIRTRNPSKQAAADPRLMDRPTTF